MQNKETEVSSSQEDCSEIDFQKTTTSLHRKKSGSCGWKTLLTAIFSFFVFVIVLGGIGFGVVWVLDNERIWKFGEVQKPEVSDVIRGVDEKIVAKEAVPNEEKDVPETDVKPEEGNIVSLSDLTKVSVSVLNAGGEKGSAGKVGDVLKRAGYSLVKTGNASIFTYKNITVFYENEASKGDAEQIATTLKKQYATVTTAKAVSSDEKREKVVVMVGEQ